MKEIIFLGWSVFMLFAICYCIAETIGSAIGHSICTTKCKQCKKRGRETNEIN